MQTQPQIKTNSRPLVALILGIIGMIAWLIPIIGAPVQITGFVFGILGLKAEKKGKAIVGIVLCIIGFILTIINAIVGALLFSQIFPQLVQ